MGRPRKNLTPEEMRRISLDNLAKANAARGSRPWTDDEDAIIRARYRHGNHRALAADLNRTIGSLRKRAYDLGELCRHHAPHTKWTPERDATLLQWAGIGSARDISPLVGVKPRALQTRMKRLGVTFKDNLRREVAEHIEAIRRLRICLAYSKGLLTINEAAMALGVKPAEAMRLTVREAVAGADIVTPRKEATQ